MTQREYELAQQIADVTGDDIQTIHSRGFNLIDPDEDYLQLESDLPPQVVDWDSPFPGMTMSLAEVA